MYPKQKGSRAWDQSQMHNALRGNVSTYRLDPRLVASLIEGHLYPPMPEILSATIGITFVGPNKIRESTMPQMFRVRRSRVRAALEWLKDNNPLYEDIIISEDRLTQLPEDAVPDQLLRIVKYSNDIEAVEKEHAGYVPGDDDDDGDATEDRLAECARAAGLESIDEDHGGANDASSGTETEPAVIPMQSLGVIDIEGSDITSSELLAHALSNTAQPTSFPEDYAIRRGSAFVNEYARKDPVSGLRNDGGPSNANHLLGCFPCLFPYGQGGFEIERAVEVGYECHSRWAMEYHDKRFRKDPQFPFQVFGVMQKREVCRSAVLQMKKSTFLKHIKLINSLREEDLIKASQEETRGVPFSHPGVRALRNEMAGVRTKVKGTDESRHTVRSKVWGTNLLFNAPTLWMTINPADTQNPIAQVFAGAEGIDLDAFCATAGPDHVQRATNVAEDPFASAQFFHFTVKTVLEQLFGIKKQGGGKVHRETGVLGQVQAYIGTVEAQGRGTLHLHMVLWLTDAPTANEIKAALLSPAFRDKMKTYIKAVVQADIQGKTKQEILAIPKVKGVSYTRPFDPRASTSSQRGQQLAKLVRALQYHKCTPAACLKIVKGRFQCKRRAPFAVAAEEWVDEVGHWGPKRLCDMINAFNPAVMHAIAANHDVKLILDGKDTATITFYITNYATKKQQRSSNVSALLAKSLAFSKNLDKREKDFNLANKRLIQRCANSLTRYREFSAPEVMTYIMNWGDVYQSHHYVPIYWDSVERALSLTFPELSQPSSTSAMSPNDGNEGLSTLKIQGGKAVMKDNVRDYKYRGDALLNLNFFDFMLETYEGDSEEAGTTSTFASSSGEPNETGDGTHPRRGRPRNQRVPYREGSGKTASSRIIRTPGHETLPRFVGKWFPRNNGESPLEKERYAASILALLKPWTNLAEIKAPYTTFSEAFDGLLGEGDRRIHNVVHNIQYYYDCLDGAKARQQEEREAAKLGGGPLPYEDVLEADDLVAAIADAEASGVHRGTWDNEAEISEEDIEIQKQTKYEARETAFGDGAVLEGYDAGFFHEVGNDDINWEKVTRIANDEEVFQFKAWAKLLKDMIRRSNVAQPPLVTVHEPGSSDPGVTSVGQRFQVESPAVHIMGEELGPQTPGDSTNNDASSRPKRAILNVEQRRAHDIFEHTLTEELAGSTPPQLRMLLLGQGGTGKSLLIGAIHETMDHYGVSDWLAKCATTGIAASDIGGRTLHSWAGIARNMSTDENWLQKTGHGTLEKRRRNIEGKKFLILDEISMLDKKTLYFASEIVGGTLAKDFKGSAMEPFGGMHVILAGDFHQFPPVSNGPGALYVHNEKDGQRALIGREIFCQFETVVILREQIRVRDREWAQILDRLRVGACDFRDIQEIEKLVLSNPACTIPNFDEPPWSEAILVTSRHAVREQWNEHAVIKHCRNSGRLRYICPAEDTDCASGQTPGMLARFVVAGLPSKNTGRLTDTVTIAKGIKAMVVLNLSTEADVANGTRGTIEDIVLDPREEESSVDNGDVHLKYPPAMLLFRPDKPTEVVFPGVPAGLIPITPSQTTFMATSEGGRVFKIRRRQFALTPGYAFTDYKAQGQTIEYVIIDIGKPPTGSLSPFGVYVALSRSRGRDTIRLLRDFDRSLFLDHPSPALEKDMKRMERLDNDTKNIFTRGWTTGGK